MSQLRVQSFAISIDGYGAGPDQDLQNPLGVNGPDLMEWFFHTSVWRRMHGQSDGETGIDNEIAELGFAGFGVNQGEGFDELAQMGGAAARQQTPLPPRLTIALLTTNSALRTVGWLEAILLALTIFRPGAERVSASWLC